MIAFLVMGAAHHITIMTGDMPVHVFPSAGEGGCSSISCLIVLVLSITNTIVQQWLPCTHLCMVILPLLSQHLEVAVCCHCSCSLCQPD